MSNGTYAFINGEARPSGHHPRSTRRVAGQLRRKSEEQVAADIREAEDERSRQSRSALIGAVAYAACLAIIGCMVILLHSFGQDAGKMPERPDKWLDYFDAVWAAVGDFGSSVGPAQILAPLTVTTVLGIAVASTPPSPEADAAETVRVSSWLDQLQWAVKMLSGCAILMWSCATVDQFVGGADSAGEYIIVLAFTGLTVVIGSSVDQRTSGLSARLGLLVTRQRLSIAMSRLRVEDQSHGDSRVVRFGRSLCREPIAHGATSVLMAVVLLVYQSAVWPVLLGCLLGVVTAAVASAAALWAPRLFLRDAAAPWAFQPSGWTKGWYVINLLFTFCAFASVWLSIGVVNIGMWYTVDSSAGWVAAVLMLFPLVTFVRLGWPWRTGPGRRWRKLGHWRFEPTSTVRRDLLRVLERRCGAVERRLGEISNGRF